MIQMITTYAQRGLSVVKALAVAGLPRSSYYYGLRTEVASQRGSPGRKPPGVTLRWVDAAWLSVPDRTVVDFLKDLLSQPLVDYGYRKCHSALGNACFHLNHKKVYRIMKAERLLRGSRIQTSGKVRRVGGRLVRPAAPFVHLEMDIKYLYLRGEGRTIFLLTIIDTHSRYVLDYALGYQMTQVEVKQLWRRALDKQVFTDYGPVGASRVIIRSDNGSQFIAHSVREFFTKLGMMQEFTHVATPEENAHIESFHSILEEALVGIDFADRKEILAWLTAFYQFYNEQRLHSSICDLSPARFLVLWKHGLIGHDQKHGRLVFYLKIKRYLIDQTLQQITFPSQKRENGELAGGAGGEARHEVKGASPPVLPASGLKPTPTLTNDKD